MLNLGAETHLIVFLFLTSITGWILFCAAMMAICRLMDRPKERDATEDGEDQFLD